MTCPHGANERQCERCEDAEQIAELRAQCAAYRAALEVAATPLPEDRQEVLRALSGTAGTELLAAIRDVIRDCDLPDYEYSRLEGNALARLRAAAGPEAP